MKFCYFDDWLFPSFTRDASDFAANLVYLFSTFFISNYKISAVHVDKREICRVKWKSGNWLKRTKCISLLSSCWLFKIITESKQIVITRRFHLRTWQFFPINNCPAQCRKQGDRKKVSWKWEENLQLRNIQINFHHSILERFKLNVMYLPVVIPSNSILKCRALGRLRFHSEYL